LLSPGLSCSQYAAGEITELPEVTTGDLPETDESTTDESTSLDVPDTSPCRPECTSYEACVSGECVCVPDCWNKECGDDGCGGICGKCPGDSFCVDDRCRYPPCQNNCGDEVYVPSGSFRMGCNESLDEYCDDDEFPYHAVYLDAYWIDRAEVTQFAYHECVLAGVCEMPMLVGGYSPMSKLRGDHPVSAVKRDQAAAYCNWRGKQLPTEAQWEKAARGTDERIYPWGNENPNCGLAAMYGPMTSCADWDTLPVCSKPLGNSPYGACDMAGNLLEWVADDYSAEYYSTSPLSNPTGPEPDTLGLWQTVRGGWYGNVNLVLKAMRASSRASVPPGTFYSSIGFRCVRSLEE